MTTKVTGSVLANTAVTAGNYGGIGQIPSFYVDSQGRLVYAANNALSGTFDINISGSANTVANGVYTTGNQTIGGTKTFSSTIVGTINQTNFSNLTINSSQVLTAGNYQSYVSMIKSIQRGTTVGAGAVTITSVNTAKAFIVTASKGSTGTVAVTGNISLSSSSAAGTFNMNNTNTGNGSTAGYWPSYSGSISGGTTNLTTKEYSAVLTNSTTITADGPVEWQVIEFL